MSDPPLEVKVWGDFACFTRPEMKVERVSYPVMTPSAARGVLEAIFWKPEFTWRVREIEVLRPIKYFSIMRNEVNKRANEKSAKRGLVSGEGFYVNDSELNVKMRNQRNTLALQNVAYIIRADVDVRPGAEASPAKYRDQFRRRLAKGQCFAQPYFGCREFTAWFGNAHEDVEGIPSTPVDLTIGLGRMLLDLHYQDGNSGNATPRFFQAELTNGVLRVPRQGANRAP